MMTAFYVRETFNEVTLIERCWHMDWNKFRPSLTRPVPPSFALFRLLLGGVELEFANKSFIQRNNYMADGTAINYTPFFYTKLKAAFPNLGIQNSAGDFLISTAIPPIRKYLSDPGGNHGFFNSIFDELARAIWYLNSKQGLSAFVHLYRAFENLSFSFPLYFARQNTIYLKAYDQLKRYFKSGELDFCSTFIRDLLSEDPLASADIRQLKFASPLSNRQAAYFLEHNKLAKITSDPAVLDVNLADAFDFLVTLRNHYFHNLSGSNYSLNTSVVNRSDEFFISPTELGIELIGVIYGKMIVAAV